MKIYNAIIKLMSPAARDLQVSGGGAMRRGWRSYRLSPIAHRLLPLASSLIFIAFCLLPFVSHAQTAFDCTSGVCYCTSGDCTETKQIGDTAEYTAEPEQGWYFAGWLSNISSCRTNPTCSFKVGKDKYFLMAIFAKSPTEVLHIYAFGAEGGRVTSNPAGIDCAVGNVCEAEFAKGTKVILTATPPEGKKFTWRISGCSGTGTCSVLMSKTKTGNVKFY